MSIVARLARAPACTARSVISLNVSRCDRAPRALERARRGARRSPRPRGRGRARGRCASAACAAALDLRERLGSCARIGTYSGSKSFSMSTPSSLLGRSMMWPFEASTVKPRPRNLVERARLGRRLDDHERLAGAVAARRGSGAAAALRAAAFGRGRARVARLPRPSAAARLRRSRPSPRLRRRASRAASSRRRRLRRARGGPGASAAPAALRGRRPAVAQCATFEVAMRISPDASVVRAAARRAPPTSRASSTLTGRTPLRREQVQHALELPRVERAAAAAGRAGSPTPRGSATRAPRRSARAAPASGRRAVGQVRAAGSPRRRRVERAQHQIAACRSSAVSVRLLAAPRPASRAPASSPST